MKRIFCDYCKEEIQQGVFVKNYRTFESLVETLHFHQICFKKLKVTIHEV